MPGTGGGSGSGLVLRYCSPRAGGSQCTGSRVLPSEQSSIETFCSPWRAGAEWIQSIQQRGPALPALSQALPAAADFSLSRRIHFYKGVFVENDIFAREFLRKMTFFQGSFGLNAHFKQDSTGRASASMEFLLKLS